MAKEKTDSIESKIAENATVKELCEIQKCIDKVIGLPEYQKIMEYSHKLQDTVNADNAKIEKEGKSSYTYEQKTALVSQGCAITALDFAMATVGNTTELRRHIEYQYARINLEDAAAKEAESKE